MKSRQIGVMALAIVLVGGVWACDGPETAMDAAIDGMVELRDAMSDDAEAQDGSTPPAGPTRVEVECEVIAEVMGHTPGEGLAESRQLWGARIPVEEGQRVTAETCGAVDPEDGSPVRVGVLVCAGLTSCTQVDRFADCRTAPVERTDGEATVICGESGWEDPGIRWQRAVFWTD